MIIVSFIQASIRYATALLFGATGEIVTEKSGHLNLGIPGVMCMGALGGCVGVYTYGSIAGSPTAMIGVLTVSFAIVFAFLFGALGGAIYSFMTVTLRANQNITGLALTSFGFGFCKFFLPDTTLYSSVNKYFKELIPYQGLGIFGELFLSYGIMVYVAVAIAIVASIIINKTKTGLRLRSVGENPATADAVGVNVTRYKYLATMIGCGIAGLGGMFYMLDMRSGNAVTLSVGDIEAIGWLAVALVIFSVWRPSVAIFGAFVFGCFANLNSIVFVFPQQIMKMAPYVITIVVLIITSIFGSKNVQPPAALGLPYFREDR